MEAPGFTSSLAGMAMEHVRPSALVQVSGMRSIERLAGPDPAQKVWKAIEGKAL